MIASSLTERLYSFSSRSPRWFATLWFGFWGFIATAIMFLGPSITRGAITLFLYVLLPTVASSIAGYTSGAQILDSQRTRSNGRAFIMGVFVALEALAFLAPLFAVAYTLSKSSGESSILGLAISILTAGFLATAPLILPIGGLAGLLLYSIHRRMEASRRRE